MIANFYFYLFSVLIGDEFTTNSLNKSYRRDSLQYDYIKEELYWHGTYPQPLKIVRTTNQQLNIKTEKALGGFSRTKNLLLKVQQTRKGPE